MELRIISHLPESEGRRLRAYQADGINTVGVFGDEPYEVCFTNSTGGRVQVILSIDGRNVLTGRNAELDPTHDTFVVRPYDTLNLTAWPETSEHGARFVFTDAAASVAQHTQGDMGSIGYISAAVYEEGYRPPVYRSSRGFSSTSYGDPLGGTRSKGLGPDTLGGDASTRTRSAVGTGAGETVTQHIGTTSGLRQPQFSKIVQVRYMWYDELVAWLSQNTSSAGTPNHPTGFVERPLADLGTTPRQGGTTTQPAYPRFI